MAVGDVTLSVTNNEDFDVGRGGHHFEAGVQDKEVTVQHYRAREITACSYFTVKVVEADSPAVAEQVSAAGEGNSVEDGAGGASVNATKGAKEKAQELDVDLAGVQGSGEDGKVLANDVKAHAEASNTEPGEESITQGQNAGPVEQATGSDEGGEDA